MNATLSELTKKSPQTKNKTYIDLTLGHVNI